MSQKLISDTFALSPMQQGMLFHYLKEPHSGVDIEQIVVHLFEHVDVPRLESACQWLIQRHEILRARFAWEGREQAHQEILSSSRAPFIVVDARQSHEEVRAEHLRKFLEVDRIRGFDLREAPMLRFTLFQWTEMSYALVWTFHHALLDGRCYGPLLREAFEAYEELLTGDIKARHAPYPYRRYIDWLAAKDHSSSVSFWKEQLAGFSAPTPLIVDKLTPLDVTVSPHGEAWENLDQASTTKLHALAAEYGLTTNALFMGGWAILLHRYSGEEDIIFGATRACRKSSIDHADETIGPFINTIPLRVQLKTDDSAIAVVKSLRRQWQSVRPHEHTPLTTVKAASGVSPTQPLFESLVVFERERLGEAMRALGGAWAHRSVELFELTNFPLTVAGYDGDALTFKIEFDRRMFDEATVRRMLKHLRRLLEALADAPGMPVRKLPLMGEAERHEVLEGFNPPTVMPISQHLPSDGGATLAGLFEAQADRSPDAIALTYEGQLLTYRQLNAQANRLARELVQLGTKPDTLVGLCLDRTPELVVAILAIFKAGGAYLPIDLSYPADRLAFMLEDAQAPVLLTERKLAGKVPATHAKVLYVDDLLARPAQADQELNLPHVAGPDHLAYVIYTSGTTGKPKGTLIPHRNVVRLFTSTQGWFEFNERDVWTLFHSAAFDFSVWEIWGALLYGGRIVVAPFLVSRSPEIFYELLARERVTVLNQTPSAFRQLIQAEETVGQKALALRYVIFGGEALELQSLRPWFERHGDQSPRLVNMYGITETTVHVTYRPLSKGDLTSGSVIGIPIPDLQVYILDPQKEPVPIGVPGEMYVAGAGLAKGYLRRPELTGERFIPDHLTGKEGRRLYKTGDLARFLPGMDIEYLGRVDHQVKIRGFRIELGEIESVLGQHPAVRESVVMVREDIPGVKALTAYLVTSSPRPEAASLREYLKKKVPDYMVPAAFVYLDRLPLTNNGKIDRKALPIPESHRPELPDKYVAPRTAIEGKLASIWSHVLRLDRVGVHDNFFELGGDSILIIQAVSLARREGLIVGPKQMFASQTIAELAASVDMTTEKQPTRAAAEGQVQLTPIQHWFFEQELEDPHHYNQAFLFTVKERLERNLLEEAANDLARHHDALRLRFRREEGQWRQAYATADAESIVQWVDVSSVKSDEQARVIASTSASAQATLDLVNGPIWRIVYFHTREEAGDRLLLLVHHLAVDGISWRPLVEDLETLCRQLKTGQTPRLPARTASYQEWSQELLEFAGTDALQAELPFWLGATSIGAVSRGDLDRRKSLLSNSEVAAITVKTSLNVVETQALLQEVPSAYNTHINDVLLTALTRAWDRSGRGALYTNLEGHGREPLIRDLDLSRTVGWFTSIFPVRLELPKSDGEWLPGEALKSVKEQLRQIPKRGIGYGMLRYLSRAKGLADGPEPSMVFNYMGQFDQVLGGSTLFGFASESTGPWHSPVQQRRHTLEINGIVMAGCLEFNWSYAPEVYTAVDIGQLTREFLVALRTLITHCQSPSTRGRTPSDFPLARLDQAAVDRLVARYHDVEDAYPLTPIQALFYSVNPGTTLSEFDQWHCTLSGPLAVEAFQQAWHDTVVRHTILRSAIYGEGLAEPLQVVLRDVRLPWTVEDWKNLSADEEPARWAAFLEKDREQPLSLSEAPVMRFSLVRGTNDTWRFLWTVPALLLDGWSWPIVFREVSQLYAELVGEAPASIETARPYRSYVEWVQQHGTEEAVAFWRKTLKGFHEPTPLPSGLPDNLHAGKRYAEHAFDVPVDPQALQSMAARLRVSVSSIVQGAWALWLNRQSGIDDVVFGTAFAGRPVDMPGADTVVGPFVNNLPIRIRLVGDWSIAELLQRMHAHILEVGPYQYLPLLDVQDCSEVPWRYRLFESLVVFQNYLVDDAATRLGARIKISDFIGPIHTAYPLLLLVEPGAAMRITLVYDRKLIGRGTAEALERDLCVLLTSMPSLSDQPIRSLQEKLSAPFEKRTRPRRLIQAGTQNFVPPQTDLEKTIALVWQKMFGLERVSVEDNLFDLGGHSLLLVQLHARLRSVLRKDFPIVALFTYPTVRSLARFCDAGTGAADNTAQLRTRAQQQREALASLRNKRGTP